tara:strand:+ start:82 stop:795 length:714 start_codon:yes stop_codon:yes gene_type:complete
MEKSKKIKIIIGLFYLSILFLFLFYLFQRFSLDELTSYKFIKENREYFSTLKQTNLFLLSIVFIFLTVFFIFMLGFGSPIALLGGFIFGKWLGVLIVVTGLSMGATLLYIFANYFLKDLIKDNFSHKYQVLESKFKKNELSYFILFRFIGLVPFQIANLIPALFNVSIKNYFLGTFLGASPSLFVMVSLGSGIERIIKQNETAPSFFDLLFSTEIYLPIIGFILLIVSVFLCKKKFS